MDPKTQTFRGWRLMPALIARCPLHCVATAPYHSHICSGHISQRFGISFEYIRSEKTELQTCDQISLIERNYFTFRRMTECLD